MRSGICTRCLICCKKKRIQNSLHSMRKYATMNKDYILHTIYWIKAYSEGLKNEGFIDQRQPASVSGVRILR